MSFSVGIVGLPNVGKSTLFKALTKKQVDIQNYPFTTIDPNVGVVAVPDERINALAKISSSKRKIYTTIEFIDIAGLVKGASQGEGLGNKFLANIREVDIVAHVVRVFPDERINHVRGKTDPIDDISVIETELTLADLQTKEKRAEKSKTALSGLELLTEKKVIFVLNVSEKQLSDFWRPDGELLKTINNRAYIILSSPFELALSELGEPTPGLDSMTKTAYDALGLITFFTTGEQETKAWTIVKGAKAPQAAGAIHSDFERGFIKAEIIAWDKLLQAGSWTKARQLGWLRSEGKEYVVQDGDVAHFRFNV